MIVISIKTLCNVCVKNSKKSFVTALPAALILATAGLAATNTIAAEWRGNVTVDYLWFARDAAFPKQEESYVSASIEPEFFHDWNNGYDLFSFTGFYRKDEHDDERSHGDIRELSWLHAGTDWEIVAGISKVFWGVTESIHLVDVINQSDTVENLDSEDKLGQPMVRLSLIRDWGVVTGFVLPGFRERTFPGSAGRPRFAIPIDTDNPVYESSDEEHHVDFAIRYSHYIGDWEFGLSHFNGTSREPRFTANGPIVNNRPTSIVPVYEQIKQTSVDLQAIIGSWLWKLEAINRSGQGETFASAAAGFEYTLVGILDTNMDLGIISEYLYDGRDDDVTSQIFSSSPFQNDLVLGTRLTLNDAQSTEILASVIGDLEGNGLSYNVEASRRIGDSWKLSFEARGVSDIKQNSTFASFIKDNRVRTELAYFF